MTHASVSQHPPTADHEAAPGAPGAPGSAPRVALYAYAPDWATAVQLLADVRTYAAARDWTIAAAAYDIGDQPPQDRPRLADVLRMMEAGDVVGVVAPSSEHLTPTAQHQDALREWLQRPGVFADYLRRRPGRAAADVGARPSCPAPAPGATE